MKSHLRKALPLANTMSVEIVLTILLASMQPKLLDTDYVFISLADKNIADCIREFWTK